MRCFKSFCLISSLHVQSNLCTYNDHPWDSQIVAVVERWFLYRGCSLKTAINFGKLRIRLVVLDRWSLFRFDCILKLSFRSTFAKKLEIVVLLRRSLSWSHNHETRINCFQNEEQAFLKTYLNSLPTAAQTLIGRKTIKSEAYLIESKNALSLCAKLWLYELLVPRKEDEINKFIAKKFSTYQD